MTHLERVKKTNKKKLFCRKYQNFIFKKGIRYPLSSVILPLATTKKAKMFALKIRKKVKY